MLLLIVLVYGIACGILGFALGREYMIHKEFIKRFKLD